MPGQVQFTCRLNLAGGESAEATVEASLFPVTLLSSHPGAARFSLPSEAEAAEGRGREGGARFVGGARAGAETVAVAASPIVGEVPGEGVR